MSSGMCKECKTPFSNKKWGYSNLCQICDEAEKVNKSMGVIIADGKTDYYVQVISSPSDAQASLIRSAGLSHDPRTQLKAINKVSK